MAGAYLTERTVMSSCWPWAWAASAISSTDRMLISRVRSNPNSSPAALQASTTPSERKVRVSPGARRNFVSEYSESAVMPRGYPGGHATMAT